MTAPFHDSETLMERDFVIITLADLELGTALGADPGAASRFKNPERWHDFCRRVSDALSDGRRIDVHTAYADGLPDGQRWRVPLDEAPEPWRSRIARALATLAPRGGDRGCDTRHVNFVF